MNPPSARRQAVFFLLLLAFSMTGMIAAAPEGAPADNASPERHLNPYLSGRVLDFSSLAFRQTSGVPRHERATETLAATFFEAQEVDSLYPLLYVDGPCLVVARWDGENRLSLSISDPELDLSPYIGLGRNLSITLNGTWRIERATAGVDLRPGGGTTVLTFFVRHGQSFNVGLVRSDPPY